MPVATISEVVARALAEDVGDGDVTTRATVPEQAQGHAPGSPRRRQESCSAWTSPIETFRALDPEVGVERLVEEGDWREDGGPVWRLEGSARALLTGERTALNFLQRLSGVATMAARCVRAVRGHRRGDPRHAQDDAGAAGAREGGGGGRRRHQPPVRAVRRDPDQGEPRGARRRGGGGGAPSPARTPRAPARGRVPHAGRGRRGARGGGAVRSCSTT